MPVPILTCHYSGSLVKSHNKNCLSLQIMKVPLSWLKEYLPTQLSAQQIAETLTSVGLEFEGMQGDVLEIALTPNLSHCGSIRGIARELAAVKGESLHHPKY